MTERILVGVTEASVTQRAIDWAVGRAKARGSRIELVSVVGGAVGSVGEGEVLTRATQLAQEIIDEAVANVVEQGVPAAGRVERGNPVGQLIDDSKDVDLLVLGSDYKGPDSKAYRGSHGIRIVAGAACPVVVVPDYDLEDRHGIVVGIDGSPTSEAAVRFAAAEADRLSEPLIAVSVWTPVTAPRNAIGVYPPLYVESMQAATEEVLAVALAGLRSTYPDLEIVSEVRQGYPSAILNEFAASARMAVLGTHGRGAIARFLLGSISQEVLMRLGSVTAIVR